MVLKRTLKNRDTNPYKPKCALEFLFALLEDLKWRYLGKMFLLLSFFLYECGGLGKHVHFFGLN